MPATTPKADRRSRLTTRHRGRLFLLAQRLGRSLMLPIAAMPAAALMVRFGQADMLGAGGAGAYLPWLIPFAQLLDAAGSAVMLNLPLLFAIGVAIGFARKADGSTGLAAVIGFLTYQAITRALSPVILGKGQALRPAQVACLQKLDHHSYVQWDAFQPGALCNIGVPPTVDFGVLGGIVIGLTTAVLWQRFYRIQLPQYLGFFAGRRFVPMVVAAASGVIGVAMSLIYPLFDRVIAGILSPWLMAPGNNVVGGFAYGTGTRLLLPFGLHHLLNAGPWLTFGECESVSGEVLRGEIACFYSGVAATFQPAGYVPGAYMTGFFPIMMGGLLGAAAAMYRCAQPHRKPLVRALLVSGALTSFVTGITEPLEFAFAYAAAPLYIVHALLTGSAFALVNWLGIRDGFSFSAGIIDYALNFTRSAQLSEQGIWGPILLLVIGAIYALAYYLIFTFAIRYFDIPTPGRGVAKVIPEGEPRPSPAPTEPAPASADRPQAGA